MRMDEWGPWARWAWGVWYTTVITFPWLVTIVYWGVLYPGKWFEVEWDAWVNVRRAPHNSIIGIDLHSRGPRLNHDILLVLTCRRSPNMP